ncbi:hypothetical protein C1752_08971 [Acaryochloris thomasi RCC1774]|uniref:Uncharacterized protein n=1 Tax=Acaryochloris thomasi RCC1774 TaxID=1764569 RepID=A0A2W1J969_9CYAN|nr:hypothetical protein C1752_08971 [Acaryochloris thomasi RCC1774]
MNQTVILNTIEVNKVLPKVFILLSNFKQKSRTFNLQFSNLMG